MNARPALSGGAFTAGFAVCNPNNAGWVVANTTNLASGAVDIGGIALETAVSGGASVQVLTAGYCPPEVIGTLSGTGDWVQVGSTGALSRGTSVTSATIGKYQSDGGVIVNLSLQSALVVAAVYDSGYVLVSDYGATDAALTAADSVAQGYTPPKRLLATEQITLANNITVASELVFEGGSIAAASAKTLTLSHSARPERRQIVFGSAVLALGADHKQTVCYPEMWGADPGGYLCNGVTIAAGLTLANGDATVGGSGFTSAMIGRTCIVFEQLGLDVFRSTVASINSSSSLELSANSTADITTASGSQVFIATATDSLAAIRAAIVFAAGEVWVELAPNGQYCVSGRLDPITSTGALKLRGNHAWIRYVGAAGTTKVFSSDDGTGTTRINSGCYIENVNFSGCMNAQDGVYMASESAPGQACAVSGIWRNVAAYHCTRYGQYHHAAQVARFERPQSFYTGDNALTFIACNGSSLMDSRGSYTLGATKHSLVIDSYASGGGANSYGGGDVEVYNHVCEAVTGNGIRILDTGAGAAGSGSVVAVFSGHLEGTGTDGIHVARRNTVVCGLSISGPGGSTYYAYRVTADGNGSHIKCLSASNFGTSQMGGIIETGATQIDFDPVYNGSTGGAYYDPVITDGWADKWQVKRSTGDTHQRGKLFIGTSSPAPTHSLQLESGSALLDKGNLLQTLGQLGNAYGGIGLGINALVQSETLGTTWTASSCTVTSNAAEGPFGGTVADRVALTLSGGLLRQPVTAATMGGLTIVGSTFIFSVWARAVSGTSTVRMYLINQAGGAEVNGNSFSDWTLTTAWRRIWVAWTSTSSAAPDAIRCGMYGAGATYDIYAWGAQLEFYSAASGLEQRHPGAYAKTLATPRVLATAGGAVANVPPVLPGGTTGAMGAATTDLTITDARITATSKIDLYGTSAAGLALLATGYWHQTRASGSVVLRFGVASAGGETFEYVIKEAWAA